MDPLYLAACRVELREELGLVEHPDAEALCLLQLAPRRDAGDHGVGLAADTRPRGPAEGADPRLRLGTGQRVEAAGEHPGLAGPGTGRRLGALRLDSHLGEAAEQLAAGLGGE